MKVEDELDLDLVRSEWPQEQRDGIYFNSGSCGVKPVSVLSAIQNGWLRLNQNPTRMTFLESEIWERTRALASNLFGVNKEGLILTGNSTYGIQQIMQTFLINAGDEFICTDQEHSCVKTISRYLSETRGIITRQYFVEPSTGSEAFCQDILDMVDSKTKLVLVSQINCLSGWRPNLQALAGELKRLSIPLLVDGAHAPGQGPVSISRFPLWVASGHKWMGGPNGTGFLFVDSKYIDELKPLCIGDRYYDGNECASNVHRFEWPGTCDLVRWLGMQAALELQVRLGPEAIAARQKQLQGYLRNAIAGLAAPIITTPNVQGETTAILSLRWDSAQVHVPDLREYLWNEHKIFIQPHFASAVPGHGMRISTHIYNTESEIDLLVWALQRVIY